MWTEAARPTGEPEPELRQEHAWLIQLCRQITGDADSAEDLAQETLLAAWRQRQQLRDPARRRQWLAAIARNLCRRWLRRRAATRTLLPAWPADATDTPDAFDFELELERAELATLLDRALALLPATTRTLLIERYVHDSPHAEAAARLGLSAGAAMKRIERGKLLLRRVLTTEMRPEALAYGLVEPDDAAWQPTRIWCYSCGRQRLLGRFIHAQGDFTLRCPTCSASGKTMAFAIAPELFSGVKGYRSALGRLVDVAFASYEPALGQGMARCYGCRQPTRLYMCSGDTAAATPLGTEPLLYTVCEHCGLGTNQLLSGVTLGLPASRRFWREHSRIYTLPVRQVHVNGRPALLTGLASRGSAARLDALYDQQTLALIQIDEVKG